MAAYKFDNRNYDKTLIVNKDGNLVNLDGTPLSTLDTDYLYRLITFTADGWIITHGKAYNGTGVADKVNFGTGKDGSLLYINSDGDSILLTPTDDNNGQVLKYNKDAKAPYWASDLDTRYTLTINGTSSTYTQNIENSLGSIYAPTTAGTGGIPSLSGTAWSWNTIVDTIGDSSAGIPTVNALKNYVGTATAGLTGAMHYIGDVSKNPTEEAPTEAETPTGGFLNGDVVTYGNKEFVKSTSGWRELGDEGSYLLKTSKPLSSTNSTISIGTGDIGTGITLDLATIKKDDNSSLTGSVSYAGTFTAVTGVTYDTYGRVTGVNTTTYTMPASDEIDFSSLLYWSNNTTKASSNPNSAIANPYLQLILNDTLKTHIQFNSGTGISVSANGEILTITNTGVTAATASYTGTGYDVGTLTYNGSTVTFKGHDTWRPIQIYKINLETGKPLYLDSSEWKDLEWNNTTKTYGDGIDTWKAESTGTDYLKFSASFSVNSSNELDIAWAEVDSSGNITYAI